MSNCKNVKLSKCQSNCQIITISNVMYYQSMQIKLAHRLCTDFQYFLSDGVFFQASNIIILYIKLAGGTDADHMKSTHCQLNSTAYRVDTFGSHCKKHSFNIAETSFSSDVWLGQRLSQHREKSGLQCLPIAHFDFKFHFMMIFDLRKTSIHFTIFTMFTL